MTYIPPKWADPAKIFAVIFSWITARSLSVCVNSVFTLAFSDKCNILENTEQFIPLLVRAFLRFLCHSSFFGKL